jgi:TonB family protein
MMRDRCSRDSAVRRLTMLALVAGLCAAPPADAQQIRPGQVVVIDLAPPMYPPIAISARIEGTVRVLINVSPDGRLESAEVADGPAILRDAALHGVRASRFECAGCGDSGAPHTMLFSFVLNAPPEGLVLSSESHTHYRITRESPVVIPYFSSVEARSIKCLYLWRCGVHWGGMDYYYYRARSGRCFWMWECGWRRRE